MMSFETTKVITGAERTMTAGEIIAALDGVVSNSKPEFRVNWKGQVKSVKIVTLTDKSGDHIRPDRKQLT
jgi:hypothetical protein